MTFRYRFCVALEVLRLPDDAADLALNDVPRREWNHHDSGDMVGIHCVLQARGDDRHSRPTDYLTRVKAAFYEMFAADHGLPPLADARAGTTRVDPSH